MSTEWYTPQEWEDEGHGKAGVDFGTSANCAFRWAPTWYEGDWNNPEVQAGFIQFLESHPGIKVPTDQGPRDVSRLLEMLSEAEPGYTPSDVRLRFL